MITPAPGALALLLGLLAPCAQAQSARVEPPGAAERAAPPAFTAGAGALAAPALAEPAGLSAPTPILSRRPATALQDSAFSPAATGEEAAAQAGSAAAAPSAASPTSADAPDAPLREPPPYAGQPARRIRLVHSAAAYRVHRALLNAIAALTGAVNTLPAADETLTAKLIARAGGRRVVLTDLDGTLVDAPGAPLRADIAADIAALRAAGKDFAVLTRHGGAERDAVFGVLSALPVAARVGVHVATDGGARVYRYDSAGEPELVWQADADEPATKATAARRIADALNAEPHDVLILGSSLYAPRAAARPSRLSAWGERLSGRPMPSAGTGADSEMEKALPGALTLSVGGSGDPHAARLFVLLGRGPDLAHRVLASVAARRSTHLTLALIVTAANGDFDAFLDLVHFAGELLHERVPHFPSLGYARRPLLLGLAFGFAYLMATNGGELFGRAAIALEHFFSRS
jgi:hypothetical protein